MKTGTVERRSLTASWTWIASLLVLLVVTPHLTRQILSACDQTRTNLEQRDRAINSLCVDA